MRNCRRLTAADLFTPSLLMAFAIALPAQSIFDDWRIRQPNPPANALKTAIYAEGRFVAAGYHATVVTSATGSVWETRYLEPDFDARGLVYAEGTYVMIDRDGLVATSENLDAWFIQGIGASTLDDLIYAEGRFLAVGRLGRLFASEDALTWTRHDITDISSHFMGIAYGNGVYLAVARGGKIFRSTSLDDWTEVFAGFEGTENLTDNWEGMAFINGTFVAYGPTERMLVSTDNGASWIDLPLAFESRFITHTEWKGKLWIGGQSDAIIHSEDGLTWDRFATGIDESIGAMAASPERIVALDDSGDVLASEDGVAWSVLLDNDLLDFRSIAYRDGIYLAMAEGDRILRSTDGVNWTEVLDASATNSNYTGLGALEDRFVAVGGRGEVAWSADGLSWETGIFLDFPFIVREVSVANGLLFAGCDSGVVAFTSDGINWTERDTGAGSGYAYRIEQVSYFNGTYFAAGGNGTLASSTDLENWTLHPTGDDDAVFETLMYFNNRYILMPSSGSRVLYSEDLVTWTDDRTDPPIRAGGAWIFDGRIVVADNRGFVYTSEDGETFLTHALPASTFREIVFDGEQYVAVGPVGLVATTGSEPLSLLNLTIQGTGNVDRTPDQALYDTSTVIRLTAQAPAGQQFLWWETTDGVVPGETFELNLEADTNITAVFASLAPPDPGIQLNGNSWFMEWMGDPAWVLHESADLVDWSPAPGVEVEGETRRLANQGYSGENRFFQFRIRNP